MNVGKVQDTNTRTAGLEHVDRFSPNAEGVSLDE
jgi:hypothetical protein